MGKWESFSPEETKEYGKKLAEENLIPKVYCLRGDLGAGKTMFTKGFAEGLGITEDVTSPTFSIINEHYGNKGIPLYHFDVYRIQELDEMEDTGYEDYFYGEGVCFVEWADIIAPLIPKDAIWITITKDLSKGEDYRLIEIEGQEDGHDFSN